MDDFPSRHLSPRKIMPGSLSSLLKMGLRYAFSLLLIGRALSAQVSAADASKDGITYFVYTYGIDQGLPHNSALSVIQTQDGYIWSGTESGLCRFDGIRFVAYRVANTPALHNNLIRVFFEDNAGILWFGTQSGLSCYKEGVFKFVGLDGLQIKNIAADRNGSLWIGTNKGLWELHDGVFIDHNKDEGFPEYEPGKPEFDVTQLFFDSIGRLWIGFGGSRVVIYEKGTYKPLADGSRKFLAINRFIEFPKGTVLLATDSGLLQATDNKSVSVHPITTQIGKVAIRGLFADRSDNLWVFTDDGTFLKSPDQTEVRRRVLGTVSNIRNMIQDMEGSYWIGTAGDGLVRIRPAAFSMVAKEDEPLGGNTRTLTGNDQGTVWAGLPNVDVAQIDPDGKITYIKVGPEPTIEVWSVCKALDGSLWVGTRGSLRVIKDGQITEYRDYLRVRAIFQDRNGTIWIGSETKGTTQYKDGVFTSTANIRQTSPGEKPQHFVDKQF